MIWQATAMRTKRFFSTPLEVRSTVSSFGDAGQTNLAGAGGSMPRSNSGWSFTMRSADMVLSGECEVNSDGCCCRGSVSWFLGVEKKMGATVVNGGAGDVASVG